MARPAANAGGRGYDFRPLLAAVPPYVRGADLALCHVETPMSPRPPTGYPIFNTPPQLARAIRWAGYDACDTASNHSLDLGQYGIDATSAALHRAGVRHTGSFRSPQAARKIVRTLWSPLLEELPHVAADPRRCRPECGARLIEFKLTKAD